jgi:hypothetical protein
VNKALTYILPVVVLGAGVGLVMTGVINVPGVSPKAKKAASALYTGGKDPAKKPVAQQTPAVTPPAEKPAEPKVTAVPSKIKPELGDERLASLWNEIPDAALIELIKDWKDTDVAKVLVKMEDDKVAKVIAGMKDTKRASRLTKALQKEASIVPQKPEAEES